jgi:hypothetical protein
MAITNTQLTSTSPITVFSTVGQAVVSTVYVCNTSGSDVSVDVHAIAGNIAAAGAENAIYANLAVVANDTYVMDVEKLVLENGDALVFTANTANAVTVTVSSFST